MSWSTLAAKDKNECSICGERLPADEFEGAVAFINCGTMVDKEAQEYSNQEHWTPCSLIVGMDYKQEYICHSKCLEDAIIDSCAENLRRKYPRDEYETTQRKLKELMLHDN